MGSKKKPLTETVTISAIAETAHEAVKVARQILAHRGVSNARLDRVAPDTVVRGAWNVCFTPTTGKNSAKVVNMKRVEGKPHTHEGTVVFDEPGQVGLELRADEAWDGKRVLSASEASAETTKRISEILGPPTPEHDKLKKVSGDAQVIGEFLDWLTRERGIVFCERTKNEVDNLYVPAVPFSIEKILAEYFGIDLKVIEQEKNAILDYIRAQNGSKR